MVVVGGERCNEGGDDGRLIIKLVTLFSMSQIYMIIMVHTKWEIIFLQLWSSFVCLFVC